MNKPLAPAVADPGRIPYQKPQPHGMRPDMVAVGLGEQYVEQFIR